MVQNDNFTNCRNTPYILWMADEYKFTKEGEPLFHDPVDIKIRIEHTHTEPFDREGNGRAKQEMANVGLDIVTHSLLYPGTIALPDPDLRKIVQVVGFEKVEDLTLGLWDRWVSLVRFKSKINLVGDATILDDVTGVALVDLFGNLLVQSS